MEGGREKGKKRSMLEGYTNNLKYERKTREPFYRHYAAIADIIGATQRKVVRRFTINTKPGEINENTT